MICEVTDGNREVILRDVKFSDVIAVIQVWLFKKELWYSNPEYEAE